MIAEPITFSSPAIAGLSIRKFRASADARLVPFRRPVTDSVSTKSPTHRVYARVDRIIQPVIDQLEELEGLPANWDSYSAEPISAATIDAARAIAFVATVTLELGARSDTYLVNAVPVADGGIQLEWEFSGEYLEIEIHPDGTLSTLYVDRGLYSRMSYTSNNISSQALQGLLQHIVTR